MSRSKADILASLDAFDAAYVECALWSSTDESDDAGGRPLDDNYGPEDIARSTLLEMQRDCQSFKAANERDLQGLDAAQCGHDFWLTRNGHGAGFWDRGLGERGDRLSKASKVYGSVDLMVHRRRVFAA
jgi:hypothetical protein